MLLERDARIGKEGAHFRIIRIICTGAELRGNFY